MSACSTCFSAGAPLVMCGACANTLRPERDGLREHSSGKMHGEVVWESLRSGNPARVRVRGVLG
jgi:hypothetical protein